MYKKLLITALFWTAPALCMQQKPEISAKIPQEKKQQEDSVQRQKTEKINAEKKELEQLTKKLQRKHQHKRVASLSLSAITLPYNEPQYLLHYKVASKTITLNDIIDLCEQKYNPFEQDSHKRTALHYAAIYQRDDIVKYLLSMDYLKFYTQTFHQQITPATITAIINLKDEHNSTAFDYAFYFQYWSTTQILSAYIKTLNKTSYEDMELKANHFISSLEHKQQTVINNFILTVNIGTIEEEKQGNWLSKLFCCCCGSGKSS